MATAQFSFLVPECDRYVLPVFGQDFRFPLFVYYYTERKICSGLRHADLVDRGAIKDPFSTCAQLLLRARITQTSTHHFATALLPVLLPA